MFSSFANFNVMFSSFVGKNQNDSIILMLSDLKNYSSFVLMISNDDERVIDNL